MKLGAAGLALLICLSPTLYMLGLSLGDPGYREILSTERQLGLFWRSLWVSGLATLLAAVWGGVVAQGIRHAPRVPGAVLETMSLLPLLLPSISIVMGWYFFLGPSGPVNRWFGTSIQVFSPAWAAFVMSVAYFPCVTILLLQGFRNLNPAWGAVARLNAGRFRTTWRIHLPLLAPYAATGALLVFLLSFADLGIPSALRVNVYPVEIFVQMSAYYDIPKAMAYCTPPIALAVVLICARHLLVRHPPATVGHPSKAVEIRRQPLWTVLSLVVLGITVGIPLAMTVITVGGIQTFPEALSIAGHNALNTAVVALNGTWLLLLFGLVIALALPRWKGWIRAGTDTVLMLPLVIPGAAVGLGLVMMDANGVIPEVDPAWRVPWEDVRRVGMLSFGLLCRWITFPTLILAASLGAIRPQMVQAAELAGAGPLRRFFRVILPLAFPGLLAATVISLVFCLGELSASALINPPGWTTLPVRIASLLHFGEDRIVAALSLTLIVLVLGVFLLGLLVLNRKIELNLDARGN